ncbi:MAG: class I SAM-dependent methyltransferase [FCB group bacterium]|nr:class I SAM-dependent methyltransferase [FCB group bacterium]
METTRCIICHSDVQTHFADLQDRLNPENKQIFSLVRCECGFIFLNPRPAENEIAKYYASTDYDPHKSDNKTTFDRIYGMVQKLAMGAKYRKIRKYYRSGKLLDIGGGQGEFCEYMAERGWQVCLQDNSIAAQTLARKKGITCYHSLSNIDEDEKFDLITLWHSLEHIHDTEFLFAFIRDHLKKEGILIVAVPNHDAPERKWYQSKWAPYDAPRHLYHFTADTLRKFLHGQGFESDRQFGLLQDTPYNILLSMGPKSVKNILRAGLILVNSLCIFLLYGVNKASSVVFICKKD